MKMLLAISLLAFMIVIAFETVRVARGWLHQDNAQQLVILAFIVSMRKALLLQGLKNVANAISDLGIHAEKMRSDFIKAARALTGLEELT